MVVDGAFWSDRSNIKIAEQLVDILFQDVDFFFDLSVDIDPLESFDIGLELLRAIIDRDISVRRFLENCKFSGSLFCSDLARDFVRCLLDSFVDFLPLRLDGNIAIVRFLLDEFLDVLVTFFS